MNSSRYALVGRSPGIQALRLLLLFVGMACGLAAGTPERPNILWITSEDNTAGFMRLYHPSGGAMPNLEALAEEGIVFEHAFSNAPVCSTARSALISGAYGPRTASHQHRRVRFVPPPDGLRLFPHYLRAAGYYTSNNVKTDYNFADLSPWSERSSRASWRNRAPGQPFFHVQNHTTTHEHKLHFPAEDRRHHPTQTDPAKVELWPMHPDTPLMRYTYARYHDQHAILDEEIGALLAQLEEDGLRDNTIIFYFGDHGGVLPGSKGYLREVGLHVPLVVWFPERWRHLSPMPAGSRWEGFVNFVDFAPTMLNLARVRIPKEMDGRPFLGPGLDPAELAARDEAVAYADRFDEKHDFSRSLRQGQWKYIRNYQPWMPEALHTAYRYKMLAFREWRELFRDGRLDPIQARFFLPKAPEELYDLEVDPFETRNLAADPSHRDTLGRMRLLLTERLAAMPDLGFIPEPVLMPAAAFDPAAYGRKHREQIANYIELANVSLEPGVDAVARIAAALGSADPIERYWALTAALAMDELPPAVQAQIRDCAQADGHRLVRARAAEYLAVKEGEDYRPVFTALLPEAESALEASWLLNQAAVLIDHHGQPPLSIERAWFPAFWQRDPVLAPRLDYLAPERGP